MNRKKYLYCVVVLVLLFGFRQGESYAQGTEKGKWYSYSKHYDEPSETTYYLTRIKHKDNRGKLNKLMIAHSTVLEGEPVHQFAKRVGATLAFNASMGVKRKTDQDKLLPVGIQILDGKVLQNRNTRVYTLGIKPNNELVAYPPGTTPEIILQDGTPNALTAFIPLIEDFKPVDRSLLDLVSNFTAVHPRQIIAQMENLDIVFLSCGGRGFEGKGMLATDVTRILQKEGVKFAFMLDGGGSTSTVINDTLITPKVDKRGTKERPRPNFLYFMSNN